MDKNNNIVSSDNTNVTLAIGSNPGGGVLTSTNGGVGVNTSW